MYRLAILWILLISASVQASQRETIVFSCQLKPSMPLYVQLQNVYTKAFRALGYDFKMLHQPNVRAIYMANMGNVDGTCFRVKAFENNKTYLNLKRVNAEIATLDFSAWVVDAKIRKEDIFSAHDANLRIGFIRGAWIVENTLKHRKDHRLNIPLENPDSGLSMLLNNRLEVYIDYKSQTSVAFSRLSQASKDKLIHFPNVIVKPVYPYLCKCRSDLAEKLADAIKNVVTQ